VIARLAQGLSIRAGSVQVQWQTALWTSSTTRAVTVSSRQRTLTKDADEDVFFHMEDIGGPDLEEGQEVEFDIEQADKGPRATNLQRL